MIRLITNKRGIQFEYILIAFVIFSLFIVGGTLMMTDLNDSYGEFGVNMSDEDFTEVYDTTDDIAGITRDADGKVINGDVTEGTAEDSIIKGAYSALREVPKTYSLFSAITNAIETKLGIPPVITKAAYTVFTLIVVFSVVYLIFRFIPK